MSADRRSGIRAMLMREYHLPDNVSGKDLYELLEVNPDQEALIHVGSDSGNRNERYLIQPDSTQHHFLTSKQLTLSAGYLFVVVKKRSIGLLSATEQSIN